MNVYPPGSLIGGRFEVAGRPLMGGQGVVYLCVDRQDQQPVAFKTLRPELLPNRAARDRFLREGTHWVDLGAHPHIVRCYQVVRVGDDTEVYLALELVAKEQGRADASLRSWLVHGQPLPAETALLFALQATRGMQHAVTKIPGFVHRDLKPENLLVGADRLPGSDAVKGMRLARILRRQAVRLAGNPANRLRVTDFGLVRVMDIAETVSAVGEDEPLPVRPGLTRMGRILGTPSYMAPEQWNSPEVDMRADVYALGCILGEMLIGRPLVQKRTPQGFRQAHQGGHASEIVRDLPGCLVGMLGCCLAVNPAARYGSWGEVEAALEAAYEEVTGGEAPAPEPEPALGRAEPVAAGWSYAVIGSSYYEMGEAQTALRYFERAQVVGAAEGDAELEAAGWTGLGGAYDALGDAHRGIGYHEQALAISRQVGNRWEVGSALGNLGAAYGQLGDHDRATGYHKQHLAVAREIGDRHEEGMALGNLGATYLHLGDVHRAISFCEESLAITREIGDRRGEGSALGNLGSAHTDLGNSRRAIGYCEESLDIAREIGDRRWEGSALYILGHAYEQSGDACRAIGYYERALAVAREVGDRVLQQKALDGLGTTYYKSGDACSAVGYYQQALAIARETGDRGREADALGDLANSYVQLRNTREAIEHWQQAQPILEEIGDVLNAAGLDWNLALFFAKQGRYAEALPHLERAVEVFAQAGQTKHAQKAQNLLARIQTELR